jgi:DNA topoisomerase-2
MLAGNEPEPMTPWYKGFRGTIKWLDETRKHYYISGEISEVSDTELEITDLPPSIWTQTYDQVDISFSKLMLSKK